ncbi:MAG: AzlC family ABC transporter permease [Coriobacteriia bacterium]|nr:AzlC family ABC transporter permease [Coriobacteriia bacterium]
MRGVKLGTPIFLGYVPVGAAFGILASRLGFSIGETIACSATALAGAGQFIALSLLKGGSSALTTLFATTVVNLRYLLFSTTLSPHLRDVSSGRKAWLAFTLTDETFAVNIADLREGRATPASMAGVGFIAWAGWVLGTLLGSVGAEWIGDPTRWGVEFAMPAMFAALFVALADDARAVAAGLMAAAIALVLPFAQHLGIGLDPAWFVVIASMCAATLASVVFRER